MAIIREAIRTVKDNGDVVLSNIIDSNTGEAVEYIKVQNPVGITPDGVIYKQLDTAEFGTEIFKRIYTDNIIHSKWFNINNSGTVDNTQDFQKIANILQYTKDKFILSDGEYNITDVNIFNNFYLEGNGEVIINSVTTDGFIANLVSNITIKNVKFRGVNSLTNFRNLFFTDCNNVLIENVEFIGGENGIRAFNSNNFRLINCIGHDYTFWANHFTGGQDIFIHGCTFYNCIDGIKLGGLEPPENLVANKNISVIGNICYNNSRDGFDMASNVIDGLIVSNNIFRDNTLQGIDCKLVYQAGFASDVLLTDNIITGNLGYGINFQCDNNLLPTKFEVTISNNKIYGAYITSSDDTYGIRLAKATKGYIYDNTVENVNYGIRLFGSSNIQIYDNKINGITTALYINSNFVESIANNNVIENNNLSAITQSIILGNSADLGQLDLNIIRHNRLTCNSANVPLSNIKSTNTRYYSNIIGITSFTDPSLLTRPSTAGDIFEHFNPVSFGYYGFISTSNGIWQKYIKLFGDEYTTILNLQTTDNIMTTKYTSTLANNTVQSKNINIIVKNNIGNVAKFDRLFTIENTEGVARVVADQVIGTDIKEGSLSTCDIIIDATGGSFRIRLQGVNGETLTWKVLITENK